MSATSRRAAQSIVRASTIRSKRGGGADRHRVPRRHLEDNVGRGLIDLRVLAADDARERRRALGVGDDEVGRLECPRLAVERGERLAVLRVTNHQLAPRELLQVEHVARVAQLEGDEVGDIDDVVDRPLAHGLEGLDEPIGARADLHAADQPGGEERADVGLLVDQSQVIADVPAGRGLVEGGGRERAGLGGRAGGGDLPRAADVAQEVAPVAGDLDIERDVAPRVLGLPLDGVAGVGEHVLGLLGGDVAGREAAVEPVEADIHGRI
jgi:hypothetical protein